ncbi:MAG: M48 family metalloprotease [Deltaproteobacteria bacterium]|nr:M48 family metalloprotease [Deltaproteobacteria bacterium]
MTPRRRGARGGVVLLAVVVALAPVRASAIGLAEERELGARFALEARVQLPLLRVPAVTGYLRDIGTRLVARLDTERFPYRFYVVRDASLNAFAVPGGYVYVHSGLVLGVASEGELAGVLAHEIVHVGSHHAVRQQEKTALISYGTLLGLFLAIVHPALGAGALAAGTAAELKYQREFEQEADTIGLELMAPAGFDPAGMPTFLRRVLREQRLNPARVPPYFLSHPLTEDRVAALEQRVGSLPRPAPRPDGELRLAAAQATIRALTDPAGDVLAAQRAAVAAAPNDPAAAHRLGLALLYVDPSRPDEAEPLLARAAAAKMPGALGDLGRAQARLGRADDAARSFEAALRLAPDDAALQLELGKLALAGGEAKRAAALFAHALALDPELDEAEYGLGECAGRSSDARGQWTHLGRAFELRADLARARSAYEKALESTPEDGPERAELRAAVQRIDRVGTGR